MIRSDPANDIPGPMVTTGEHISSDRTPKYQKQFGRGGGITSVDSGDRLLAANLRKRQKVCGWVGVGLEMLSSANDY